MVQPRCSSSVRTAEGKFGNALGFRRTVCSSARTQSSRVSCAFKETAPSRKTNAIAVIFIIGRLELICALAHSLLYVAGATRVAEQSAANVGCHNLVIPV